MQNAYSILISHESPRASTGNGVLGRYIGHYLNQRYPTYYLNWRTSGQPGLCRYKIGDTWYTYRELTTEMPQVDYGQDYVFKYLNDLQPDLLLTIGDPLHWQHFFRLDAQKNIIGHNMPTGVRWLCYAALDSQPLLKHYATVFRAIPYLVVFTEWAKRVCEEKGANVRAVIPHGVDTELYRPIPPRVKEYYRNQAGLRKRIILGGVGINQGRKRWDLWLEILAEIKKKKPNIYGWYHGQKTAVDRYAPNIFLSAERLGLEGYFGGTEGVGNIIKTSFEQMRYVYGIMDFHLLCSTHGAWELPSIEAMSCGVPAGVTDYGAMREALGDAGIPMPVDHIESAASGMEAAIIDVKEAAERILYVLDNPKYREKLILKGRERANNLDWRNIMKNHWYPLLDSLLPDLNPAWMGILERLATVPD